MEIITSLKNFETLKSSTLTIGSYDGIHRGHHRILQSVIDFSKSQNNNSVLITFNPHPKHIIGLEKDSKVQLIMSLKRKLEIIESLGMDFVYVIPFTEKFSKISAQSFLDQQIIPFLTTYIKYFCRYKLDHTIAKKCLRSKLIFCFKTLKEKL